MSAKPWTEDQIAASLSKHAERGDHNARTLLAYYSTTTPEERKARRAAAVERYRQRATRRPR